MLSELAVLAGTPPLMSGLETVTLYVIAAKVGNGGGAGAREPRRPKPAPSSEAVSLPGPADERYLDLAAVSAPAAADARPTTAGALQRPPGTWRQPEPR